MSEAKYGEEFINAAKEFERGQRESSRALAKSLADFAVKIATQAPASA